jgi:glutaredoxin
VGKPNKTCTTYTKFGCRYCQQMQFLISKDGEDFTLFHNAYRCEYYKLLQWEHKRGDNGPVESTTTETHKTNIPFDFNDRKRVGE